MKRTLTAATLLVCSLASWGQDIASVANGLYYMPTTWDCLCIPGQSMNITINHQVSLNNDLGLFAGSITINASGALVQDAVPRSMLMTGGTFTNNGTFGMDRMTVQGGSFANQGSAQIRSYANHVTFINSGTISGTDTLFNVGNYTNSGALEHAVIYNGQSFENMGTLIGADSLYNAGALTNGPTALIEADSLYNEGTLTNDGTLQHVAFTNAGTYNNHGLVLFNAMINLAGMFHNHGTLEGTGSMTNSKEFFNYPGSTVTLGRSFLNGSLTVPPAPVAVFTNDGTVTVGDSWYNFDLVIGVPSGYWSVQDSSVNAGSMTGDFRFCDHSPVSLDFPVVDINLGTVDPTVQFCQLMTAVAEAEAEALRIYPNPATTCVTVEIPMTTGSATLRVVDSAGRTVYSSTTSAARSSMDLIGLNNGLYTLEVIQNGASAVQKLIKQ